MAQAGMDRLESSTVVSTSKRARGIVDLSGTKLTDKPAFLEEKLRKTHGIVYAEINAFSNRMTVEFDPSLISIEKIRDIISVSPT